MLSRLAHIDADKAAVCMDAANDGDMKHPGERDVIHKERLTAKQPRVLGALDALAEKTRVHARPVGVEAIRSAARRTAATMLWYPVQRHRLPDSA